MASEDSTTEGSKSSPSDENQRTIHSLSPAPSEETRPLSSFESKYDDELEISTPLLKTDQQQTKDKKKKKQQSSLTSVSNKAATSRMPEKRRREEQQEEVEENDGMREPPSKKKTVNAVQQESPAKENTNRKKRKREPVSTPSSSQKAAKKVGRVWSPQDELVFFNGLLEFYKRGKGLPKNMAPVYDHIRNTLDNQYSNRQFADKVSRWKCKFRTSVDKEKAVTISFRSPHDAAVYNVCKQIWGGQDDDVAENEEINENHSRGGCNAENVGMASMDGKDKKKKKNKPVVPKEVPKEEDCEEDMKKTEDQEDQEGETEEEEDEDQENPGVKKEEEDEVKDGVESKKAVDINMAQNVANDLAQLETLKVVMSPELYSKVCEERDAMVTELKIAAVMMLKESELKTKSMIEDHFNTKNDHRQLPNNKMIDGFLSAREAPVLSKLKADALEEKWRKQQILEMEAYCKRLDLLQEECNMCLEELEAPMKNGGY